MRTRQAARIAGPLALAGVLALGSAAVAAAGRHLAGQELADEIRRDLAYGKTRAGGPRGPRGFYFTRAIYSGVPRFYGRGPGSWAVDWPKADVQFVYGLRRLTYVDAYERDNAVNLTDPELWRYPFLYALEVGFMQLTEPEVESLRRYLLAGGFLFIDDFWGTLQWRNFETEIGRVLPEYRVVELSLEHPLFHSFYDIERLVQVPSVAIVGGRDHTWEQDGYEPYVRAIFDADGRLMVLINWNTDLGDAWEWVDNPYYPLEYSNYAYQLAVNAILYSMSH